jgi:hypothetical protein
LCADSGHISGGNSSGARLIHRWPLPLDVEKFGQASLVRSEFNPGGLEPGRHLYGSAALTIIPVMCADREVLAFIEDDMMIGPIAWPSSRWPAS